MTWKEDERQWKDVRPSEGGEGVTKDDDEEAFKAENTC
jgi:hypothetical protein